MHRKSRGLTAAAAALALGLAASLAWAGPPKGAKAIFDSGEGPASGAAVVETPAPAAAKKPAAAPAAAAAPQKYVGISYELLLLTDDGQIRKVPNHRVFKTGERLIMRVMTNRPGYLKIYNIGPSGNVNVLAEEIVDAYTMTQVPRSSAMRFVGAPGEETILIMLGDPQAPSGPGPGGIGTASAGGGQPMTLPGGEPGPAALVASNIDGAKSAKGAKDLVAEDSMKSAFAVVSPQSQWQPVRAGTKDLVLESADGTNYGVVPAAAVSGGGVLSLMVKLRHN
jgi:hypothetical protein